jgi:hypothetical protein
MPVPTISALGRIRTLVGRAITFVVMLAVVGAGSYVYYHVAYSKCKVPVKYSIGTIDPRFKISEEEVRAALADAESLWEDATGKNLFTYDENAPFAIDFVYDERQQNTEEQHALIEVLDRKASMSESIRANYEKLLSAYNQLKTQYEGKVASYEKRLAAHNAEVEKWNANGGAPEATFRALNVASNALNVESASLNEQAQKLNALATQINQLSDKGNAIVEEYNKSVATFNKTYEHGDEFTQGDYTLDGIRIYQYDDATELRRILAHELGHALSLDHVDDEQAVMHEIMEGQHVGLALRYGDIAEYHRVCGTR